MKHSRISRVVQLLTVLQGKQTKSADELAELIGVSRRTLFRDLGELSKIGVPYYFDNKQGGYKIDPDYYLPSIDLTLQEALSLLMLVYNYRDNIQLPFKHSALIAGMKVENNLPHSIQNYCNTTLRNISVKYDSFSEFENLDKTFSLIQSAIHQKRKLAMTYDSLFDKKTINLQLSPLHLSFNRRAWYVIGRSSLHNEVRTFKLSRILKVEPLEQLYVEQKPFDIEEHYGLAWSMIPEGHIYSISLRFSPKVAKNVTEVQWHSTQKASFCPDGSVCMDFKVDGLGEISWWILGYGDQVEVIKPAVLRKKIADTAKKMLQLHS